MRAIVACVVMVLAGRAVMAASDAILTVRTVPAECDVWLDDSYVGQAPVHARHVSAGTHTLRIVWSAGQTSQAEQVTLAAGEHTVIERTVGRKYGTLKVSGTPGAQVGMSTVMGTTPFVNQFVAPGSYRLDIARRGYEPIRLDTTIAAGDTIELVPMLKRKSPFTTKALVRLALGAGAAACFTWALIEQGQYRTALERSHSQSYTPDERADYEDESHTAATLRTIGLIGGGLCVVGFEVVAFF